MSIFKENDANEGTRNIMRRYKSCREEMMNLNAKKSNEYGHQYSKSSMVVNKILFALLIVKLVQFILGLCV